MREDADILDQLEWAKVEIHTSGDVATAIPEDRMDRLLNDAIWEISQLRANVLYWKGRAANKRG